MKKLMRKSSAFRYVLKHQDTICLLFSFLVVIISVILNIKQGI
ncbi:MAG: hypothetical protein ACK40G_09355 [Cytophagaceae bacterium]